MINGERRPLRPFEQGEIGPISSAMPAREGMVSKRADSRHRGADRRIKADEPRQGCSKRGSLSLLTLLRNTPRFDLRSK